MRNERCERDRPLCGRTKEKPYGSKGEVRFSSNDSLGGDSLAFQVGAVGRAMVD
jgi:hypothetical protein